MSLFKTLLLALCLTACGSTDVTADGGADSEAGVVACARGTGPYPSSPDGVLGQEFEVGVPCRCGGGGFHLFICMASGWQLVANQCDRLCPDGGSDSGPDSAADSSSNDAQTLDANSNG